MGIAYDENREAIINPWARYAPLEGCPQVVVGCFAHNLVEYALERYGGETIAEVRCANGATPLYRISGTEIGLTMVNVGASRAVKQFEDLFAMGVEQAVVFGTCGVLDRQIGDCAIILPDCAVREEGTSYHYAPPSHDVAVNAGTLGDLKSFFDEKKLEYSVGKVWTTDAFYRETPDKLAQRRAEGCIAVDSECSALAALAQFRRKRIVHFFYAADNLDAKVWNPRKFTNTAAVDAKQAIVDLAFEFGMRMAKDLIGTNNSAPPRR